LLTGSVEFKHTINEDIMGIMVTYPVANIEAKRMIRDVKVNAEMDAKTKLGIVAQHEINLIR
jgi:hypothetical protein